MTQEEHKQRHIELHRALDELGADFFLHTKRLPSFTTIMELIEWSHRQTLEPDVVEGDPMLPMQNIVLITI